MGSGNTAVADSESAEMNTSWRAILWKDKDNDNDTVNVADYELGAVSTMDRNSNSPPQRRNRAQHVHAEQWKFLQTMPGNVQVNRLAPVSGKGSLGKMG